MPRGKVVGQFDTRYLETRPYKPRRMMWHLKRARKSMEEREAYFFASVNIREKTFRALPSVIL